MKREDELERAVSSADLVRVRALLRNNPDLGPHPPYNYTPLHLAVEWPQYDMVQYRPYDKIIELLLDAGADIDARDNQERTPLTIASRQGHDDLALLLLKRGAAVHFADKSGSTALTYALWMRFRNDTPLIKELLRKKSPVSLWDALWLQDTPLALSLVERIDPHTVGMEGFTPLHLAALMNNVPVARKLLLRKASVKVRTTDRLTPLHLACGASPRKVLAAGTGLINFGPETGREELVQLLLKFGASRTMEDKEGQTAYDWAKVLKRPELLELLKP